MRKQLLRFAKSPRLCLSSAVTRRTEGYFAAWVCLSRVTLGSVSPLHWFGCWSRKEGCVGGNLTGIGAVKCNLVIGCIPPFTHFNQPDSAFFVPVECFHISHCRDHLSDHKVQNHRFSLHLLVRKDKKVSCSWLKTNPKTRAKYISVTQLFHLATGNVWYRLFSWVKCTVLK